MISKTYIAAIASLLASVFMLEQAQALELTNAVVLVVTFVFTLYGRYQAGGVNVFGLK